MNGLQITVLHCAAFTRHLRLACFSTRTSFWAFALVWGERADSCKKFPANWDERLPECSTCHFYRKAHVSSWFKSTERWRQWAGLQGGYHTGERGDRRGVMKQLGRTEKELWSWIMSPTFAFTCKLSDTVLRLKVSWYRWRAICCFWLELSHLTHANQNIFLQEG